jgi:hypothetical protein
LAALLFVQDADCVGVQHWVCNVSTCNRPRTGLVFCNVSCWDAHLSVVRHREPGGREAAPSRADWEREQSAQAASSPNASMVAASPTERSPRGSCRGRPARPTRSRPMR